MNIYEISIMTILLGGIQFLIAIWIKYRLENSIKHEYDKLAEDYRYNIRVREQAARVSEYLALARSLKKESGELEYERANQLSWEMAMWLPADIYRNMVKAIVAPDGSINELTVVIEVRKLLLGEHAGNLSPDHIAYHAPGIGVYNKIIELKNDKEKTDKIKNQKD